MQSDRSKILVVGGGIGGLAFSLACARYGTLVDVWERAQELREVGAGLLLTANAMWVVDQLGIGDAVRAVGRLIQRWEILDRRARILQTFRQEDRPISISITRAAFHETMRHAFAAERLHLDREVVAIESTARDEETITRAKDGTTIAAEILIGADGGRSRVRDYIDPKRQLRDCGYVGWRALVDHVPHDWKHGRISESWGEGCRFGISPVSDTRCYWYATENVEPGWTLPVERRKAHLLERFRHWHRPVAELIEATPDEQILLNSIVDHPPLPRWTRGRMALLGDAAHLMTPNLGQGAAMALEDAWVLAQCLNCHGCTEEALRAYEQRRWRRVARVSWQSRQVGHLIQCRHPLLTVLRDTILRWTPDALGMLATAPVFHFRG